MNTWRDCKLGDLLQIKHGFAFLGEHFASAGTHVVLTPGNFLEEGGFKEKADKAKWYNGPIPDDYVLNEGDLLVAMTEQAEGLLGSSALIPRSGVYLHNQRLGLVQIRDRKQADQHFIYYLFNSKPVRQQIRGSASGTKIRHTAPSRIADVKVSVPPLPVQRRIAGILSAYDELMENSQRRIRILEAMARALYREWFVHFRFPGHEKHPRVASPLGDIPQGWEVKTVADSFEISGGGTPSRKEEKYWDGGTIQWFSPSNLTVAGTMFMDDSSDHITELGLAESSARLFPARSAMLTSRATIGAIAINTHEACTNQGFITCLPNDRVPLYFLFHWLTENVPTFQRMASGATFKEISRGVFKTIEFLQPPAKLVRRFEDAAAPMAEQALALQRQIQNLRRTRDLLLPRLLSGQVQLSQVDKADKNIIPLPIEPPAKAVKKTTDEFVEAVLIAQLTRKLASPQFPLGRLRYNKLGYFAHRKAEDDVAALYLKKAAGPYSPWAKYQGPEKIALKNGYVNRVKAGVLEGLTTGDNIDKIDRYLSHYPVCDAIDWVVTMFRYRRNDDLELLATIDFAALDLLRGGAAVTLATIKHIIATNTEWAPKLKREIFSDENITRALTELRGLFPNTYAP